MIDFPLMLSPQNYKSADIGRVFGYTHILCSPDGEQEIIGAFRNLVSVKVQAGPCIDWVIAPVIFSPVDNGAAGIYDNQLVEGILQALDIEVVIYVVTVRG